MNREEPLEFAILVSSPPLHTGSDTAFEFVQAALNKGHLVKRIFFYRDGVYHGSRLLCLENPTLIGRWRTLAEKYEFELILCSASAARRGIMGKNEANYFDKDTDNLAEPFQIASLSLWFEAVNTAKRVMVFGDTL